MKMNYDYEAFAQTEAEACEAGSIFILLSFYNFDVTCCAMCMLLFIDPGFKRLYSFADLEL